MVSKRLRTITNLTLIVALALSLFALNKTQAAAADEIPFGSTILSATLSLYVSRLGNVDPNLDVNVHRINQTWNEIGVSWSNFHGADPTSGYDADIVTAFNASVIGWVSADITALVVGWVADPATNYGLLIENAQADFKTYYSSEWGDLLLRPKLTIEYQIPGDATIYTLSIQRSSEIPGPVQDAYIWSHPDYLNYDQGGVSNLLFTGRMNGYVKHSLLRFQIPVGPPPPPPASLGDRVWNDINQNGIQDAGEVGIANVTVNLYACGSNVSLETQYTNENGLYLFTGLTPGDYYVEFIAPSGFTFSPQDIGNDALDSDADRSSGMTICTNLIAGESDLTWDAGLYQVTTNPGTGTPGYWKNHPEAWPVNTIEIGGVTYSKEEAISWLEANDKQDKTVTMFRALVAAKLNILNGNDASCIAATIAAADSWMASYGPVGAGLRANTDAWKVGEPLYWLLDQYNNGYLCVMHRD